MRCFAVLIIALSLAGSARAENADAAFRSGLAAFNEGAYGRARAAWDPLAAAGDARAQTGIGFMLYSGRGVALDRAQAAEFFERAAQQGEPTAQLFLALMYFKSDGLPSNPPLALMWVELAIDGGQPGGFLWRDAILQSATEAERQEGWRLLARWRAAHDKAGASDSPGR
jgi:TPR repeat protein